MRTFLITEKKQWTYHGPFFIDLQEMGRRKASDVIHVIYIYIKVTSVTQLQGTTTFTIYFIIFIRDFFVLMFITSYI